MRKVIDIDLTKEQLTKIIAKYFKVEKKNIDELFWKGAFACRGITFRYFEDIK